jgi:hypothetical protein
VLDLQQSPLFGRLLLLRYNFAEAQSVNRINMDLGSGFRGVSMPIRRFLEGDRSFEPDEIEVLVMAFEDALLELQLTDREDAVTLTVARRIIELARQGERDPARLRDRALESLRS